MVHIRAQRGLRTGSEVRVLLRPFYPLHFVIGEYFIYKNFSRRRDDGKRKLIAVLGSLGRRVERTQSKPISMFEALSTSPYKNV